jgi:very-short-patch-repair endonuclease
MDATLLDKIAAEQAGLFTRSQARACGYSGYQIRRRRAHGEWQVVLGPVMARAGMAVTPRLRDRAAHLAVPQSILAGPSAARWHGIDVDDLGPCLAVWPHDHPRLVGVRLLRQPPPERDILLIDGVLVTTRERAVFDCVRVLPEKAAVELLDRALQRRWITVDELLWRTAAWVGRRGAPRLVRLIRLTSAGARSAGERLLVSLLRGAAVTGWSANRRIHDMDGLIGEGDVVFERERLVVEVDGWAFHVTPERFQRDRERQNRLIAAGWTVLRFTWRDLTERPDQVIATIRATLARLRRAAA